MAGYIGSKASVVSSGAEHKKTFTITGATTSLTGLNYTVGKVHVFQNGVRLVDGTDYTATNGTTITLTAAAQSGDNVVVISQAAFQVADALLTTGGTMSGDLTVQGAFTSQGIDDNGNATAMTIDSSENVQFGTTQTFPAFNNVVGCEVGGFGQISASRDGAEAMQLNRKSSDGNIALLKKDGTTVGSIGVIDGNNTYFQGASGHGGIAFGTNSIVPFREDAYRDSTLDIGQSNSRFRDLYLSGGVNLGGVGTANRLHDYEEGTFTPNISWTGVNAETYSRQVGSYVKIGQFVYCSIALIFDKNTSTGNFGLGALPFTNNASSSNDRGVGSFGYYSGMTNGSIAPMFLMENNQNFGYFRLSGGAQGSGNGNNVMTNNSIGGTVNFHMDVTYRTTV